MSDPEYNRRRFFGTLLTIGAGAVAGRAAVLSSRPSLAVPSIDFDPSDPLIRAPDDPAAWPAFRDALVEWRAKTRERIRYDDALYRRPEFAWVPSSFACGFLMLCDESFYDRRTGRYTVEA